MTGGKRILVVDDEPVVTGSCRRALTSAGHQVEIAESGREGLNRALSQRFDVVVTDLRMPDLDGMDLVRSLRKNAPQTAIVIITGHGTIPSAVTATSLGVSEYIEKPFTPGEIVNAVNKALPPRARDSGIEPGVVGAVTNSTQREKTSRRKILLVVDGSTTSNKAVEYVRDIIGGSEGFEVTLYHVIRVPATSSQEEGPEDPDRELRVDGPVREERARWIERSRRRIEAEVFSPATRVLAGKGVRRCATAIRATLVIEEGPDLASAIVEEVRQGGYSTVVLPKGRRSLLREFLFWCVTGKVVHLAEDCAVWLVE